MLSALLALALGAGCGREPDTDAAREPEPPIALDGERFDARLGALELESGWSWELESPGAPNELGGCDYAIDAGSAPTGSWQAEFSRDRRAEDPVTGAPYPNGHWKLRADGAFGQVVLRETSSAAYRCSPDAAADTAPVSVHLEMILGAASDGVEVQGYVTRLSMTRIAAPIDAATGRAVLLSASIPAPLRVEGEMRGADGASDGAIALALSSTVSPTPAAPWFEFGLYTGVLGMTGTARVTFRELRLTRSP